MLISAVLVLAQVSHSQAKGRLKGAVVELPAQRYFNVVCMAYGADPNLFADVIQC